jgi:hypothetical protein
MKKFVALVIAVALLTTSVVRASAEIIERILAVVGGELIMLSDAVAARRFGLVDPPKGGGDPVAAMLDALIDRQLQLIEVNRYLPPEPTEEAISSRLADIRRRFASPGEFESALAETGMNEARLRSRIRDNLRIESYRAQRFAAAMQPSDEDLLRYYRLNEPEFMKDGVLQPFEEVREQLRARVGRERTEILIRDWLETLRRRSDVQILYRTASPSASAARRPATLI